MRLGVLKIFHRSLRRKQYRQNGGEAGLIRLAQNEEIFSEENGLSLVRSLSAAGTRPGRAAHHRSRRAGERHAHVVALDDGVRAAACGVRGQQPELFLRQPQGQSGMCDQHSHTGAGENRRGLR